jgi:hypothetical protein
LYNPHPLLIQSVEEQLSSPVPRFDFCHMLSSLDVRTVCYLAYFIKYLYRLFGLAPKPGDNKVHD